MEVLSIHRNSLYPWMEDIHGGMQHEVPRGHVLHCRRIVPVRIKSDEALIHLKCSDSV